MTNMHIKRMLAITLSLSMAFQGSFGSVVAALASQEIHADDAVVQLGDADDAILVAQEALTGLTNFSSPQGGLTIDEESKTVTIQDNDDNHYAVYEGLEKKTNSFVLETDVRLADAEGNGSAAIIFGLSRKNAPGARWSGANFDTGRGGDDVFRIFGPDLAAEVMCGTKEGVDFTQPVHLKLDVDKDGNYTYSFGNVGSEPRQKSGRLNGWNGGFVGLLTWNSEATFSNISFEDRTEETPSNTTPLEIDERYHTNLAGLSTLNGAWEITDDGLRSNAIDKGDAFMYSATEAADFVYSTDVKFFSNGGAASLVFRSDSATGHANSYAVNLDAGSKACKFWRWTDGDASQLINEKVVEATEDGVYTLKVVAIAGWVSYYVNDTLVASSGDYTLQPDDRGQDTCYTKGHVGLLNWNGDMAFQNTFVEPIEGTFDPTLTDIAVASSTGTVEGTAQFSAHEPIFIQYVKNNATTVDISASTLSDKASVVVKDAQGNIYPDGKGVPVAVGKNYIDVVSTATANNGTTASLTYRVNVHRRQVDAIYYNEPFRDQYHYSVKDGWGNDPNGMVYYKGVYHFFYQFYDDVRWGPMHWGHATSKDLIHWEEQPMALYPDANGAMFSGCAVVDDTNASGLFSTDEGGLVALITADGNGQRIKLAYSEDEGKTWTKVDKVVADWSRDPLGSMDFRDPKVFRWEGKWFMVVAGGPLRIYSSDNLVDWKCESTYANLHTECPDLYPIEAPDGAVKWVLSRGGRKYKVGDFRQVDGNWTFVPDSAYSDPAGGTDGIMNFGKDSYAAMTFYVQDFGTVANPTLPDIIEINWMNTWDDYCNAVAEKVGQQFNGTYNLALKEGLIKDGDTYLLTQTPVDAYKQLRTNPIVELKGVDVAANNDLLKDFAGECYEIESTFYPAEGTTKVGFQLRVGDGESTDVIYDVASQRLSIDRSKSGTQISGRFSEVDGQKVTPNADGSVTLHVYMDRASVEVFSKSYTVAGGNQIFPALDSTGAKVVVEGANAKADITIYGMDDIWEKTEADKPLRIQALTPENNSVYAGDTVSAKVALLPVNVKQDISWTVDDPSVASIEAKGASAKIAALKKGTATITATSLAVPELSKTFVVNVFEDNFETNLDGFVNRGGVWVVDDKTLSDSNAGANDFYMAKDPVAAANYTMSTKVKYTKGLVNIFFAGNSVDPFDRQAYAIQLGDSSRVRLFRFAGDTLAEGEMGKTINDGEYHDVRITKSTDSVFIAVDGKLCLAKKFEVVDDFYNASPYVGLGLWDGGVEFQTLYVNPLFPDVTDATPHVEDIYWLGATGVSTGFPDGTFRPMLNVVRQDMAAFLFRVGKQWGKVDDNWQPSEKDKTAFSDVDESTPHYREILWLASVGISTGFPDGTFRPMQSVVRQDMAAFLFRLAKLGGKGGATDEWVATDEAKAAFGDVNEDTAHSREVFWLASTGVSTGFPDGTYRPMNTVVRQDMAAFLHRLDGLS